jgi:hypothetical protein
MVPMRILASLPPVVLIPLALAGFLLLMTGDRLWAGIGLAIMGLILASPFFSLRQRHSAAEAPPGLSQAVLQHHSVSVWAQDFRREAADGLETYSRFLLAKPADKPSLARRALDQIDDANTRFERWEDAANARTETGGSARPSTSPIETADPLAYQVATSLFPAIRIELKRWLKDRHDQDAPRDGAVAS